MMLGTLGKSPSVWDHDHRIVDPVYGFRPDPAYVISASGSMARLNEPELLDRLERSHAPCLVIHAIAESHRGDSLLAQFPDSKVVWLYRDFVDVSRSALRQWGDHQRDLIRRVHVRDWAGLGWRGEGLPSKVAQEVSDLYRDDLTDLEGSILFWYLRNQFFLHLDLRRDSGVFLAKYEDLVRFPDRNFEKVFRFLDIPYRSEFVASIYSTSVRNDRPDALDPDILSLATSLLERLDELRDSESKAPT